jgi:hypothetical protein
MGDTMMNGSGSTPGNPNDPDIGTAAVGGAIVASGQSGLVKVSW